TRAGPSGWQRPCPPPKLSSRRPGRKTSPSAAAAGTSATASSRRRRDTARGSPGGDPPATGARRAVGDDDDRPGLGTDRRAAVGRAGDADLLAGGHSGRGGEGPAGRGVPALCSGGIEAAARRRIRSEEHTSELQSREN